MSEFLVDVSHTAHSGARTGVQRVTRSLLTALGRRARGITFDPYAQSWRYLRNWENENLRFEGRAEGRRASKWPWRARWRGLLENLLRKKTAAPFELAADTVGLIVPEIFSATVGAALKASRHHFPGPRIAIFHDAIALQLPELSAPGTVARFPGYLQELLQFDGIAAVSQDSRKSLLDFWQWLGVASHPPVEFIPLGIDRPSAAGDRIHGNARTSELNSSHAANALPIVLSVGSIEGRKNHVALLEAAELLWREGIKFELQLIGLAHRTTGRAALRRIEELQKSGRAVHYDGAASESELERAYQACAFTVYPSLREGFGLPVLESVARGKPCICSGTGALGEAAAGGGCLLVSRPDASRLSAAMSHLLTSPSECDRLAREAGERKLRSWQEYAEDLTDWMRTLARRELT